MGVSECDIYVSPLCIQKEMNYYWSSMINASYLNAFTPVNNRDLY